jgi:hypothetical protein
MHLLALIFLPAIVAITTVIFFAAAGILRPGAGSIYRAVRELVDWAGLFAIFFALNLALGAVLILLIRGLTPRFVALYSLENLLLVVLSGAQAFVFQVLWRRD